MYSKAKFFPAGDKGIVMEFGDSIDKKINEKIRSMVLALKNGDLPGVDEVVPTYCSLMLFYNPFLWKYEDLVKELKDLERGLSSLVLPQPKVNLIPVVYGRKFGPDLAFVCENADLSREEVIKIHTSQEYLIYMLGFTPGFPYLGGMDKRIATPRLQSPRTHIPEGSVGIAGSQTGIYPIESPGGWQLIGRTPVNLYDPAKENPVLLMAGDYVKFYEITEKEYNSITRDVEKGTYKVEKKVLGKKGM